MAQMGILSVPSGACGYRPLPTLLASRGEIRQREFALSITDKQGRVEPVQQSQGKFTVTPVEGHCATRAKSGTGAWHENRQEPSGTHSQKAIPAYRDARQTDESQWASLCLPTPETPKHIQLLARFAL